MNKRFLIIGVLLSCILFKAGSQPVKVNLQRTTWFNPLISGKFNFYPD